MGGRKKLFKTRDGFAIGFIYLGHVIFYFESICLFMKKNVFLLVELGQRL